MLRLVKSETHYSCIFGSLYPCFGALRILSSFRRRPGSSLSNVHFGRPQPGAGLRVPIRLHYEYADP